MTPNERVTAILNEAVGSDLSSWEKHKFLPSIRQQRSLTDKQENILRGIEYRVLGVLTATSAKEEIIEASKKSELDSLMNVIDIGKTTT